MRNPGLRGFLKEANVRFGVAGHFRTSTRAAAGSALPLRTDIVSLTHHVRKVPIPEMYRARRHRALPPGAIAEPDLASQANAFPLPPLINV